MELFEYCTVMFMYTMCTELPLAIQPLLVAWQPAQGQTNMGTLSRGVAYQN